MAQVGIQCPVGVAVRDLGLIIRSSWLAATWTPYHWVPSVSLAPAGSLTKSLPVVELDEVLFHSAHSPPSVTSLKARARCSWLTLR